MLFAIGAGASTLALIAFSWTCWFASTCLGETIAGSVSFWEILGLSTSGFAAILLIRPLKRQFVRDRRSGHEQTANDHAMTSTDDRRLRGGGLNDDVDASSSSAAWSNDPSMHPAARPNTPGRPRWRRLYEEMSLDERRLFKAVMKRYCDESRSGEGHHGP